MAYYRDRMSGLNPDRKLFGTGLKQLRAAHVADRRACTLAQLSIAARRTMKFFR